MNIYILTLQIGVEVSGQKTYGEICGWEGQLDFEGVTKSFEYDPKDETIYWDSRASGDFWTKKKKLVETEAGDPD